MTVGITICPGKRLEAIVVTDSKVSIGGRESNSVNKIGQFLQNTYHGVIYGSGNGNIIEGIIKSIGEIKAINLDEYVRLIHDKIKESQDQEDLVYLNTQRIEIEKKATLLKPEAQLSHINEKAKLVAEDRREQHTRQLIQEAMIRYDDFIDKEILSVKQRYEQFKQGQQTGFVLVAYDKDKGNVRQFRISQNEYTELFQDHTEIGSGGDGAHMYFAMNLQGVTTETKFATSDLAFLAINAYNNATINQGVGGTPRVMRVSEQEVFVWGADSVRALVNLSGAYLSRFAENKLTNKLARKYTESVLNKQEGICETLGSVLKLTPDSVKTVLIPYSSWQERANSKLFNH